MAICLFCLHEKERFLLSHPEGMKRHLEKQRLKGSQKEFIHSLLLQILWHSSWKEPFTAWVLPLPLCLPGTTQPSPAPPRVCSGASQRGQQGIQASPSLGSPRLAFPQHFTHSSSPKRNVP